MWIIIGISSLLIYVSWNVYSSNQEKKYIKNNQYGEAIEVKGRKMIVNITGEKNKKIIVLISGFGVPSPIIFYKPLVETLSKNYKVITLEPFGYGLSDLTEDERISDNIVSELHSCLQKLGVNSKYYLMAHSLGGLYCLHWTNKYPEEVLGYVGLDTTLPKMDELNPIPISFQTNNSFATRLTLLINISGIPRLMSVVNHSNLLIKLYHPYDYSKKEIDIYRCLSLNKSVNKTNIKEITTINKNFTYLYNMKVPEAIPVLHFLCSDNTKLMKKWEQYHSDLVSNTDHSEVIILQGNHIHFMNDKRNEIYEKINNWIK